MRLLLIGAALSALCLAQDAKIKEPAANPPTVPTERPLSEAESLKLQLTTAKIQLLRDKYQVDQFEKDVKPISDEQFAIFEAACISVGVDKDKIRSECGLNTGVGPDGKPIMGPDGKQVPARVWKIAQPAVPAK